MKRAILASAMVALCLLPLEATAHPLGNFTTNQYLGIHVEPSSITVDYVLDLAEIPTSQQRRTIDLNDDGVLSPEENNQFAPAECRRLGEGIRMSLEADEHGLGTARTALSFPEGEAGLPTLRLECRWTLGVELAAGSEVAVENTNFADRVGWSEMVLTTEGVVADTSLPSESRTRRLISYPEELLRSPIETRRGEATLAPRSGEARGEPPPPMGAAASARETPIGRLTSLIDPAAGSVALPLAMAVAVGLGVLHALAPGHGKTVMAAYLVGSKGTLRQALGLGLAVAVSHTVGVLALGLLTLVGTSAFAPEDVFPVLSLVSGLIVTAIGGWMLFRWLRYRRRGHHDHHHHDHDEHREVHSHGGGVTHSHAVPAALQGVSGWKVLASMGLAGGLVPSTSAVVLLLAAVNLRRVPLGILLIGLFGVGMALTLVGVGLALVKIGDVGMARLGNRGWVRRIRHLLTPIAALVVIAVGVFLSVTAM